MMVFIICFSMLLSGCSGDNRPAGTGRIEEIREMMIEVEAKVDEELKATQPVSKWISDTADRMDKEGHLFDITAMFPETEGMSLTDYAFQDREHILLSYEDLWEEGKEDSFMSIFRISLSDGKVETLVDHRKLDDSVWAGYHGCVILSAEPLILCDLSSDLLYFVANDTTLSMDFGDSIFFRQSFTVGEELYMLDTSGAVHQVMAKGTDYSLKKVWSAPKEYENVDFLTGMNGQLLFYGDPVWDDMNRGVFLKVDPSSWELTETYTAEEDTYHLGNGTDFLVRQLGEEKITGLSLLHDGLLRKVDFIGTSFYADVMRDRYVNFAVSRQSLCEYELLFQAEWEEDDAYSCRLLLWDFREVSGEAYTEPEHVPFTTREVSEAGNEQLKREIEKEFGIQIFYGKEAKLDYDEYQAEPVSEVAPIMITLTRLKEIYSLFPEGFFTQLGDKPLRIYIVKDLKGVAEGTVSEAGGLKSEDSDGSYIALATGGIGTDRFTIAHETMHAIYDKMIRDGVLTEEDEEWMKLNPPDFYYGYSYSEDQLPDTKWTAEDYNYESYEEIYFVRAYDKTYQTEDVADLFAELISGTAPPGYYGSSHMQAKCQYIFTRIRQSFDTTGWPEMTCWEKSLMSVAG